MVVARPSHHPSFSGDQSVVVHMPLVFDNPLRNDGEDLIKQVHGSLLHNHSHDEDMGSWEHLCSHHHGNRFSSIIEMHTSGNLLNVAR